ncbi:hypothetical protein Goklo_022759 [Gossypium klotzschianum]|uniref:Uncharacterized protein n=1 Tax=Gossypium klotzschianum TaxID=34286 RepID=A0A7J8TNG8_9ROSI|nr:hypothetical protein [Gossypium klotzschianum]
MTRTLVIVVDIFFGRSRRRRSHSRSKSRSSRRFRTSCEEHSYGGHGHSKREEKRAKIEQSNWEREQQENAKIIDKDVANDNNENCNNGYV